MGGERGGRCIVDRIKERRKEKKRKREGRKIESKAQSLNKRFELGRSNADEKQRESIDFRFERSNFSKTIDTDDPARINKSGRGRGGIIIGASSNELISTEIFPSAR